MADQQTILLAGGGTGGHLYPGISVAQTLRQVLPDARPLFLCTQREIDRVILQPTGFEFIAQPIVPPLKTMTGLWRFWRSWRETKDLIRRVIAQHRPVAVLGLGGYAAGVGVKLAAKAGIPAAILNPDVIPGKANQYLMGQVQAVCCQFDQTRQHVSPHYHAKLKTTGCPVRDVFLSPPDRTTAAASLGLDPALATLVITGASQGALTVNDAALETLPQLKLQGWQVLHLAGRDHGPAVTQAYRQRNMPARVIDFTPDMASVFAVADLVISRSGASTCAELCVCGLPSILFPYPFHKDMHQRANAKVLADAGAAILLDDLKDPRQNAQHLRPALESLLYEAPRRRAMAAAAKALARPDAAHAVATVLAELVRK